MPLLMSLIPGSANDMDDTFKRSIAHFVQDPCVAMTKDLDVGASTDFEAADVVPMPECVPRQVSFGTTDTYVCDGPGAPDHDYGGPDMRNATFAATDRGGGTTSVARRAALARRLHVAIQNGAHRDVLERILRQDPGSASRSVPLVRAAATATLWHPTKRRKVQRHVREPYTFPLHLAIAKEMSDDALSLLIEADPSLLVVRDGMRCDTPLLALLRTSPTRLDAVDALLLAQPFCASIKDDLGNTPLHVACQHGASLDVIKHLTILYPEALAMANCQGHLPLELARRRARDSHAVLEYLGREVGSGGGGGGGGGAACVLPAVADGKV